MVQKVPGFLVVPKKGNSLKNLEFDIWVTQGLAANPFFFTSPTAREAISKFPKANSLKSTHLGEISYFSAGEVPKEIEIKYKTKGNPVYLYEMYPYLSNMDRDRGAVHEDRFFFENKGIALNLERIALRELLKVSPKAHLAPSGFFSELREEQLVRRGMKVTSARQMFSARQMLQVINQRIGAYRIKNRLKTPSNAMAFALENKRKIRKRRR
ncbi:MAG: hypothetical protein AABW59_02210 [archaeon]